MGKSLLLHIRILVMTFFDSVPCALLIFGHIEFIRYGCKDSILLSIWYHGSLTVANVNTSTPTGILFSRHPIILTRHSKSFASTVAPNATDEFLPIS